MNEGKYILLWQKYAPVIHVLLKNTDVKNQTLQLYRHEFEHVGQKQKTSVNFSFDLIKGRATNIAGTLGIARDLCHVLDNKAETKLLLKERKIKVSVGKTYELQLTKIEEQLTPEVN